MWWFIFSKTYSFVKSCFCITCFLGNGKFGVTTLIWVLTNVQYPRNQPYLFFFNFDPFFHCFQVSSGGCHRTTCYQILTRRSIRWAYLSWTYLMYELSEMIYVWDNMLKLPTRTYKKNGDTENFLSNTLANWPLIKKTVLLG